MQPPKPLNRSLIEAVAKKSKEQLFSELREKLEGAGLRSESLSLTKKNENRMMMLRDHSPAQISELKPKFSWTSSFTDKPSQLRPLMPVDLNRLKSLLSLNSIKSPAESLGSFKRPPLLPLTKSWKSVQSNPLPTPVLGKRTFSEAMPNQEDAPKPCNCRKSKCLKLYCECFAAGRMCTP